MTLGNSKVILITFFLLILTQPLSAQDKILSSPLINLNELKPSFEEVEDLNNETISNEVIQDKKKILPKNNLSSAKFIGLDKITAKTSEIVVNCSFTNSTPY